MWYRLAAYGTIDLQKISEQEESEQIIEAKKGYNAPRTGKKKKRWSVKHKRGIDCNNVKGFSQKNYCKRKRSGGAYKTEE